MLTMFGAGLPRTGTLSLKRAIEQLGFGPCYHPLDVPGDTVAVVFKAAINSQPINWDEVFRGYNATFDVPSSYFYQDLIKKYPNLKVILTVRDDEDAWYNSYKKLKELLRSQGDPFWWAREPNSRAVFGEAVVTMSLSNSRIEIAASYREHNDALVRAVPADRLLVFDVRSGWGPLCRFLNVPVPGQSFPAVNSGQELAVRLAGD